MLDVTLSLRPYLIFTQFLFILLDDITDYILSLLELFFHTTLKTRVYEQSRTKCTRPVLQQQRVNAKSSNCNCIAEFLSFFPLETLLLVETDFKELIRPPYGSTYRIGKQSHNQH